jgi:hypothetical protein
MHGVSFAYPTKTFEALVNVAEAKSPRAAVNFIFATSLQCIIPGTAMSFYSFFFILFKLCTMQKTCYILFEPDNYGISQHIEKEWLQAPPDYAQNRGEFLGVI